MKRICEDCNGFGFTQEDGRPYTAKTFDLERVAAGDYLRCMMCGERGYRIGARTVPSPAGMAILLSVLMLAAAVVLFAAAVSGLALLRAVLG